MSFWGLGQYEILKEGFQKAALSPLAEATKIRDTEYTLRQLFEHLAECPQQLGGYNHFIGIGLIGLDTVEKYVAELLEKYPVTLQ